MKIKRTRKRNIQHIIVGDRSKWQNNCRDGVVFLRVSKADTTRIYYKVTYSNCTSLLEIKNEVEKVLPVVV